MQSITNRRLKCYDSIAQKEVNRKKTDAGRCFERLTGDRERTDGLWGNQVTEERSEHDKDHGIGNPGEVLERHIALKLPMYPLIG